MLNRLKFEGSKEAKIRYLESDFEVMVPGDFVACAISGKSIPLDELKYWSFNRQEAYVDAQASLQAEQNAGNLI